MDDERDYEAAQDALNEFYERAAPMMEQHEDFEEVIQRKVFSPPLLAELMDSKHGPEIAYDLGNNPEDAREIRDMSAARRKQEIDARDHQIELARQQEETAEWIAADRQRQIEKRERRDRGGV